jgi:hypothetical protein
VVNVRDDGDVADVVACLCHTITYHLLVVIRVETTLL